MSAAYPTKSGGDAWDDLMLEIERADALAEHIASRLSDLSEGAEEHELFALGLVAEDIRARHQLIKTRAAALLNARSEQ